jgi:hypothetical protein
MILTDLLPHAQSASQTQAPADISFPFISEKAGLQARHSSGHARRINGYENMLTVEELGVDRDLVGFRDEHRAEGPCVEGWEEKARVRLKKSTEQLLPNLQFEE